MLTIIVNTLLPKDKTAKHIHKSNIKNDTNVVYLEFLINRPNNIPVIDDSMEFNNANPKL